jgi:holliday junction resolvase YEN1
MGIPGLFKEIGKGERLALAALSINHLQKHNRPLRIAIDVAIWNFQTQFGGQGGKNPALRTFFFRLVKLLALPIHPVFVYDGKNKPLTKRGKTVSRYGMNIESRMSKKLVSLFHFPCHEAPGEAEAECALLQRKGIVDAVMTQDVDALMFGCGLTFRDWSREGAGRKGNGTPTHVSVFEVEKVKKVSRGLDANAMILVAMLSGGDYNEDGVAGIGCTLACEIARAGFGTDLLEAVRAKDEEAIREWRERLQYELETNESGYFKAKRKTIKIPDSFPDRTILEYYMNPIVSAEEELPALAFAWDDIWREHIDVPALRRYTADTFDWQYKSGAWNFVRKLAPALLSDKLQRGTASSLLTSVDQISGMRRHFDTGGISELRIRAIPADVVGLDLDAEEDSPEYLENLAAQETEDMAEHGDEGEDAATDALPTSPSKKRKAPPWLPWDPEKMWIAETVVRVGAREHVTTWNRIQDELRNDPKKFATRKCREQNSSPAKAKTSGGMKIGAMRGYVVVSKSSTARRAAAACKSSNPSPRSRTASPQRTPSPSVSRTRRSAGRLKPQVSTKVDDHFQASKSGKVARSQALQQLEPSNPLSKLAATMSSEPVEDQLEDSQEAAKHSRMSTSSSAEQAQLPSQKLMKQRGIEALKTTRKQNQQPCLPEEAEDSEVPSYVTQRTLRRRARKVTAITEISSSPIQPPKPKRPIGSFFDPYLKPVKAPAQVAVADSAISAATITPELGTGVSKALHKSKHLHALPRESLPGAWKEVDPSDKVPTELLSSSKLPPGRVSLIDLTND